MDHASLIQLQLMHRHGARALGEYIPGVNTEWYQCDSPAEFVFMNQGDTLESGRSPSMKEQIWIAGVFQYAIWKGNCDIGELINLGSHRMNEAGKLVRGIYVNDVDFLPQQMSSDFAITHTYICRTRESVENLFAGMYPLEYRSPGQTLDMHVKPMTIEVLIPNTAACPKLAALQTAFLNSTAYSNIIEPFSGMETKLVNAYNQPGGQTFNSTEAAALWDAASAAYCHGLGLEGHLTAENIQSLTIYVTAPYHGFFRAGPQAEEAKRLGVGPWLKEILAAFSDRSTKLHVYSAHDATLDMFLAVVADPDLPWPPFSASVEMELWDHSEKGMLVRLYYEGMMVPAHPDLHCSFDGCPLSTLEQFLRKYVATDLETACAAS